MTVSTHSYFATSSTNEPRASAPSLLWQYSFDAAWPDVDSDSRQCGLHALGFYNWPNLYPAYVRGESHLGAHHGREAAAEFQKILDHRGIVLNEPIGALAHLQLGRAYALQGDLEKARAAYQDFLTL